MSAPLKSSRTIRLRIPTVQHLKIRKGSDHGGQDGRQVSTHHRDRRRGRGGRGYRGRRLPLALQRQQRFRVGRQRRLLLLRTLDEPAALDRPEGSKASSVKVWGSSKEKASYKTAPLPEVRCDHCRYMFPRLAAADAGSCAASSRTPRPAMNSRLDREPDPHEAHDGPGQVRLPPMVDGGRRIASLLRREEPFGRPVHPANQRAMEGGQNDECGGAYSRTTTSDPTRTTRSQGMMGWPCTLACAGPPLPWVPTP